MKQFQDPKETGESFILVPKAMLEKLLENTQRILSLLQAKDTGHDAIGDYLPEQEAKKLLGRKTTWFWSMRKLGRLAFTRIGNKIFYAKQDIINLLNRNKVESRFQAATRTRNRA
jgi:hypothetical protein